MKKILLAVCITLCAMMFFSCDRKGSSKPEIGITIYKYEDTFMSYVKNSIEKNAYNKAHITIVDSQNSQAIQNSQVDQFLATQKKAIAINPVDRAEAGLILEKAKAVNIPVVFFNREPYPEDMAKWDKVFYVGAKAEESGTMLGEIIAEYWKSHPEMDRNNDGILQYVMITGEPGHQDAELRSEYSVKALLDAGINIELLKEDTAYWERQRAVEVMDSFLARFGDRIEAVLCNNDDMALGAIESLRKAGYFTGSNFMPVAGVDATAPALQALAEGTLLGTVLNDAFNQGKATYDIAFALATGANPANAGWNVTDSKYIWVPYQKVTSDNYKNF